MCLKFCHACKDHMHTDMCKVYKCMLCELYLKRYQNNSVGLLVENAISSCCCFFTCIINNADSDGSIFEWQVYWADKLTHNIYTQKNKHKHTAKQR